MMSRMLSCRPRRRTRVTHLKELHDVRGERGSPICGTILYTFYQLSSFGSYRSVVACDSALCSPLSIARSRKQGEGGREGKIRAPAAELLPFGLSKPGRRAAYLESLLCLYLSPLRSPLRLALRQAPARRLGSGPPRRYRCRSVPRKSTLRCPVPPTRADLRFHLPPVWAD